MPGIVAVGENGLAIRSFDGTTWATQTTPVSTTLRDVHYAAGQYVAVGDGGVILTSADGASWVSQTSGTSQDLFGIHFSDNLWVVSGDNVVLRSVDAATWLVGAGPFAVDQHAITKNLTTYVVVGAGGVVATSLTAVGGSWTPRTSGVSVDLKAAVYVGFLGLYVAAGDGFT